MFGNKIPDSTWESVLVVVTHPLAQRLDEPVGRQKLGGGAIWLALSPA